MKKLNITFCSFPDFSSNAKPLFEYMNKNYKDKFNLVWIVYNKESVEKLKSMGIKAILLGTDEFKKYIKTTDVFFTTQGNLDGDKTKKSIYVELWHGIGFKPVGYMCKNPSKDDLRGYNHMHKIFDYVVTINDFWKTIYSSMLHVEYNRVKTLGMPKLDYFAYSDGKKNLSKVIGKNVNEFNKVIIYMPTFKNGLNHYDSKNVNKKNIFNFKEYDENKLIKYLEKNNYLLVVKRHPADRTKYSDNIITSNIVNINDRMLFDNDLSINEIINAFDMLVSDYSSISTEFSFFERPIIYAINDFEDYSKNRGIIFSNFDFWVNGPKVDTIDDFIKETDKLFKNKTYYADERKKSKELFFGDLKDGGCDKICNYFFTKDGKLKENIKQYQSTEIYLEEKNAKLESENEKLKRINKEQKNELSTIVNSKGWKILEKMRKVRRLGK